MDNYAALFGKMLGAGSGGSGTNNYNELSNKPSINGTVLSGDKTAANLGLQPEISDLSEIRSGAAAGSTAVQQTEFETDQQRHEIEIGVVANAGAKNLADFNFGGVVQNVNVKPGTIVCIESNGTFSFSGTSDYKNYAAYVLKQFLLKAGTYKISGISGGSNTTYWMRIGTGTTDTVLFNLYNAEHEFNIASDTLITVQVVIYANQTVSNLIFKPMIRRAEITDDTFVPYAPTNRELYEMILALQSGGALTQSTASLMSEIPTIEPDVMQEEGEKQDE